MIHSVCYRVYFMCILCQSDNTTSYNHNLSDIFVKVWYLDENSSCYYSSPALGQWGNKHTDKPSRIPEDELKCQRIQSQQAKQWGGWLSEPPGVFSQATSKQCLLFTNESLF